MLNIMAATNLTSVLLKSLPILQRQVGACMNQCKTTALYKCTSNYATSSTNNDSNVDLMKQLLKDKFPLAKNIIVEDISGGCGEMYQVSVESCEFKGLTVVKQHRLVNDALKDQIKQMHGIIIQTTVPP